MAPGMESEAGEGKSSPCLSAFQLSPGTLGKDCCPRKGSHCDGAKAAETSPVKVDKAKKTLKKRCVANAWVGQEVL